MSDQPAALTPGLYLRVPNTQIALRVLEGPGEQATTVTWSYGPPIRVEVVLCRPYATYNLGTLELGDWGRAEQPRVQVHAEWTDGRIEARIRNAETQEYAEMFATPR